MTEKTLITFVGRGKLEGGGYIKTTYDFGENKHIQSSCFAEAIRQSGKFAFDEVLFVGTATSSWSSLLESVEEQADLWENLYSREIEHLPLTDELQKDLHTALEQIWLKPVRISINPEELTPENCNEILNKYISEIFNSGSDILLDVTHSFRWMPLLLSSALQFRNAYSGPGGEKGNIEIVYGELGRKLSPVRHLDVWRESEEISDAIALFFQKFEAEPLGKVLEPYWQDGAKAVKKLGLHIQGNYFLPLLFDMPEENFPIGRPLAQLKNALNRFSSEDNPVWVTHVHKQLKNIFQQLSTPLPQDRLVNLAKLLAERKLYGQAIIAICLAAEQSLILAYNCRKHPGYDGLNAYQSQLRQDIADNRYTGFYFRDIKHLRAQVAHGGLAQDQNSILQPESLKGQYESILRKQLEWQTYLNSQFLHDKRNK